MAASDVKSTKASEIESAYGAAIASRSGGFVQLVLDGDDRRKRVKGELRVSTKPTTKQNEGTFVG